MRSYADELKGFLSRGKLTKLPSKRKKKLLALCWLADHIPAGRTYTEKEFNGLLNELHDFGDPATLRRELYDAWFIDREPDGSDYRLRPDRPSPEQLLREDAGAEEAGGEGAAGEYGDRDLRGAAEFRERIHAEALKRVRRLLPGATDVKDPYPVEAYFRRVWDYPGAWYVIVAAPESEKSRESLIDRIVRETVAEEGRKGQR